MRGWLDDWAWEDWGYLVLIVALIVGIMGLGWLIGHPITSTITSDRPLPTP